MANTDPEDPNRQVLRMVAPIDRSGWAIAAGYLGLFAVLVLPAPVALLVSIVAVWDVATREKRKGEKVHGMGRAIFGLVMGLLFSLLLLAAVIN